MFFRNIVIKCIPDLMDIVSLKYLDFSDRQHQNLKRSYLVALFLISDIQKVLNLPKVLWLNAKYFVSKTFF